MGGNEIDVTNTSWYEDWACKIMVTKYDNLSNSNSNNTVPYVTNNSGVKVCDLRKNPISNLYFTLNNEQNDPELK